MDLTTISNRKNLFRRFKSKLRNKKKLKSKGEMKNIKNRKYVDKKLVVYFWLAVIE